MRRVVEASGARISVEDAGHGSPIVLIHGWTMSGRFFRRQIDGLAAHHRVVVPDLRGHGSSESVASGYTLPTYAGDLRAVIEALGLVRPVLVGWSMGALVVYEYLRLFGGGSIAGMVVVDQPPSDYAWDGYDLGGFTPTTLRDAVEAIQVDQRGFAEGFVPLVLHDPDPDTVAWMTDEVLRVPPAVACTALVDQTLMDYREFLAEVTMPTLVIFGEDDKLASPRGGELTASLIAGSRLHIFRDSSHCPFWEKPAEFNRILTEFAATFGS